MVSGLDAGPRPEPAPQSAQGDIDMQCPVCHNEADSQSAFCNHCGASLTAAAPVAVPDRGSLHPSPGLVRAPRRRILRPRPQRRRRDLLHHRHPGNPLPADRAIQQDAPRPLPRDAVHRTRSLLFRRVDRHRDRVDGARHHSGNPDADPSDSRSSTLRSASASSSSGWSPFVKASKGEWFKLPIIGDFAMKQAQS
jgi:hypothetical protein